MSDACEMWSLPWHALQKNLANDVGTGGVEHAAAAAKTFKTQGAGTHANSWLSRARRQAMPSQARQ